MKDWMGGADSTHGIYDMNIKLSENLKKRCHVGNLHENERMILKHVK
jgi:hypothetical protein